MPRTRLTVRSLTATAVLAVCSVALLFQAIATADITTIATIVIGVRLPLAPPSSPSCLPRLPASRLAGWLTSLRPPVWAIVTPAAGICLTRSAFTLTFPTSVTGYPGIVAAIGAAALGVATAATATRQLQPRIDAYARWMGRTAAVWHGDTNASQRRAIRIERPDILLTTPESLESLLVSPSVDPREFFADIQAVIIDEVHAFAGDDRGWHLLAVLERIARVAGRPIQRIGLSATVGNPNDLVRWLQGSGIARADRCGRRPGNGRAAEGG